MNQYIDRSGKKLSNEVCRAYDNYEKRVANFQKENEELRGLLKEGYDVINEAVQLFLGHLEGDYYIDSFTSQPLKMFLKRPEVKALLEKDKV